MIIVDAHTHLGNDIYAGQWSEETGAAAADEYARIMRTAGVSKGFTFTMSGLTADPVAGNDELAQGRDRYPDLMLPWGTVDPYWPESKIRQEMRRCIQELKFYGFKLHPWLQGFSLMVPGMEIVAQECTAMKVPVVFHDGTAFYCTPLQVAYFARSHPNVTVLSGHGGLAELWPDVIAAAKELPNYYVVLNGPVQQGMQQIYDEVGPDKLMFGSDGGSFHPVMVTWYLRRARAMPPAPMTPHLIFLIANLLLRVGLSR